MCPANQTNRDAGDDFYRALKKHLGRRARGKEIFAAFEKDQDSGGEILVNYVQEELSKDEKLKKLISQDLGDASEAQINNFITGGKIDQLINIGRLDRLTIEKKFSPFRDTKQLLVFLAAFLIITSGVYAAFWYSRQPRKMGGDFNIAIAIIENTNNGKKQTALSREISDSLLYYLETEFKASSFDLNVEITNKNMPLVADQNDLEDLVNLTNATVVIYGTVYVQGDEAMLSPRFYVSEKFDVSELTGENELAKPIIFDVTTMSNQELVESNLKTRSAILVNFTYSLIYLSDKSFDDALTYVQNAIALSEKASETFDGKENLYLVAAHIMTAQKDYNLANQMLDRALDANQNYARAYIARGNIYYGQASQFFPYDEALLEKARVEYQKAYEAKDQPKGAYIPVKAQMSLGNVFFLRAVNANDDPNLYLTSIEHYEYVTTQYETSKIPALRELTAVNYFNIGIASERVGDTQRAILSYRAAFETTQDPRYKEVIENQLMIVNQK